MEVEGLHITSQGPIWGGNLPHTIKVVVTSDENHVISPILLRNLISKGVECQTISRRLMLEQILHHPFSQDPTEVFHLPRVLIIQTLVWGLGIPSLDVGPAEK